MLKWPSFQPAELAYFSTGLDIAKAFPSQSRQAATDDVIISSARWQTNERPFEAIVVRLTREIRATDPSIDIHTYLNGTVGLVGADRHAALIQLSIPTDNAVKPIVAIVQRYGRDRDFSVAITGQRSGATMPLAQASAW